MAITVKHTKVSTVPDSADTSLVRPSDWNADHTLTGLGTMAEQNANNVTITGGSISGTTVSGYIPTSAEGVANGVATLDSAGKVPITQIPDSVIGALSYQGTWNASTNTPTLTSSVGTKGYYYVVSVAGTTNLNGITDWQIGDWAVYNGSVWQKIDNTDSVTSVNGYTGAVVLTQPDIAGTVPTSRTISTGTGLTGGGDLSANRTISFSNTAVGTWAATPSSANLAAAVTDETGSGSLVFGTNATLANPNIDVIDFDTTYATTLTAGQLGWDGNNTLGIGMAGGNVIQHIGEDQFFYCKASSAITKGQVIMFTGAVGASGVPTGAPATGITDGTYIMGVAAESIALNGFGLVQSFGTLRNINTSGYADGDILWYNPAVTGGLTKTKPSAPNVKIQIAAVINGGSSGGGTILIRIDPGSTLGGTDSNAQITSPTNGQILTYDNADAYWKNTSLTAGTGISVSAASDGTLTVTNTAPSSGGTVTSVSGTGSVNGITLTGTVTSSGSLTLGGTLGSIANSQLTNSSITINGSPISLGGSVSVGTVTSVTGTSPISSSGGTTPAISISQANSTTSGYLSSTDWNTFNNKSNTNGTVTSVAASVPSFLSVSGSPITTTGTLAISYSGTALPIANGGTNATSYTAPSGNVNPLVFYNGTSLATDATTVTDAGYDTSLNTLNSRNFVANNGMICNSMTVTSSYTIPVGYSATAAGPMTIATGQTVTISSGSRWVIL